jgi:hypothetical protein
MNWLPKHECGLYLTHNEHKDVYEDLAERIACLDLADAFESPEAMQRAIDADSLWVLQWYPVTPVGFHRIAAATLEEIEKRMKEKSE